MLSDHEVDKQVVNIYINNVLIGKSREFEFGGHYLDI